MNEINCKSRFSVSLIPVRSEHASLKKLIPVILCGLLIFLITSAFQGKPESVASHKPTLREVFLKINREAGLNAQGAQALKEATSTIGHRLTGSPNGKKAEQFAFDQFKKYGFEDVKFHEFEVDAWSRGAVRLNLYYGSADTVSPVPSQSGDHPEKLTPGSTGCMTNPEVVALAHSPVKADVFAKVVDVGNGLKNDFEKQKDSIRGKIVLLNLGIYPKDSTLKNLHRSEKTALAIQYGAAGCIFINTVEGRILLTGTASVNGGLIPIPAVCITFEDGLSFRQCMGLAHKAFARIITDNHSGKIKARNVVATIKGTELPDEQIILCGHLDCWDLATGAIDNGIGSFTVMEIARVFKKLGLKTRRTIRFVTFMGEEQGLLGSRALVKEMQTDGTISKIRYVFNLDMSGNTQGFNVSGRDEMELFVKKIIGEIQAVEPSFKGTYTNSAGLHSDHEPFMLQGIPVMGSEGSLDPYVYKFYHSNKDDFSLVNPEHMSRCARYVGMMLFALADAKEIPAHKLTDEETKNYFIKAKLKDELILGNDWRWNK